MTSSSTLSAFLVDHAAASELSSAVAMTIRNIAVAAATIAARIADGASSAHHGLEEQQNTQGEIQKVLDVLAHDAFVAAAKKSSVAYLLSEEAELPLAMADGGLIALAIDPLDGSSNIAVNSCIGTIFGLYPAHWGHPEQSFLRKGRDLLAAGYVIYGARTELVLSVGGSVMVFALDAARQEWVFHRNCMIAHSTREFAINMSNYRFWSATVRHFVDQCLDGAKGVLAEDYNMRWLAAVAGEAHRILARGGIFLYPRDDRKGHEHGRLRLLYECFPIAFLIEKSGGEASDGKTAILDLVAKDYHQKSPLCFGSRAQMHAFGQAADQAQMQHSPLFARRSLLRVDG